MLKCFGQPIVTVNTLWKSTMFKPNKKVSLLSIIPYDIFKTFEEKTAQDLTYCTGVVEKESDRDIWFGFIDKKPMRITYRESDQKTTWAPCNLTLVKQKINTLNQ